MSTGLKIPLCIRGVGRGLYACMRTMMALVLAAPLTLIAGCGGSNAQPAGGAAGGGERERVVGLPCEGCEGVFPGMPERATMPSEARVAPADEPGEALVVTGVVRDAGGEPVPGIIVYAYQTDAEGIYPRPADPGAGDYERHGTLRAWAKTDAKGAYTFRTIRPASYPGTTIPQHIHMHIVEAGRCTYYIDGIMFEDDPHLSDRERERSRRRGGSGLVMPERDEGGVWRAQRDITLGEHVPGYPSRAG